MNSVFDIYADCKADHAYAMKVLRHIAENHPSVLGSFANKDGTRFTFGGIDRYVPNAIVEQVKGMPIVAGIKHLRENVPGLDLKDGKDIYEIINTPAIKVNGTRVSFNCDGVIHELPISLVNDIKNTPSGRAYGLLHDYISSGQDDDYISSRDITRIVNRIHTGETLQ
jgi:hypothetical protein